MSLLRFFALGGLVWSAAMAVAEEVVPLQHEAIECRLRVSTPTAIWPRTVIFPVAGELRIPKLHDEVDVDVQAIGNTVLILLKNGDWTGVLHVYDAQGNLYSLRLVAERERPIDDRLVILPPPAPRGGGAVVDGGPAVGSQLVSSAMDMLDVMLGVRQIPSISGVPATSMRDGALHQGMRIYEDDVLLLEVQRIYQGPSLRGYQCLLTYRGTTPFRIPYQRLTFPGVVAAYCPASQLMQAGVGDPGSEVDGGSLQPGQVVPIYFIAQ
jgi:hypothetical protein